MNIFCLIIGMLVAALVLVTPAWAQQPQIEVTVIQPAINQETLQYVLMNDRRKIFEQVMTLNGGQREIFWSEYENFEREKNKLDSRRLKLLGSYAKHYTSLNDDELGRLMRGVFQLQNDELALRQKFFTVVKKKLSPSTASQFYAVDDYISAVVKLAILNHTSLMGDQGTIARMQQSGNHGHPSQPSGAVAAPSTSERPEGGPSNP
jgi:hypothetical protein